MIHIQWVELKPTDGGFLSAEPSVLQLPQNISVPAALAQIGYAPSQILHMLQTRAVAVFGVHATEFTLLRDGDRLEILDELKFDPMESRRRRARQKVEQQLNGQAKAPQTKPPRRSGQQAKIKFP